MTAKQYKSYVREFAKHLIDLEWSGNGFSDEQLKRLSELEGWIEDTASNMEPMATKAQADKFEKEVAQKVKLFIDELNAATVAHAKAVAGKEAEWFSGFIYEEFGVELKVPKNVGSLIEYTPYNKRNTIQSLVSATSLSLLTACRQLARTSYTFGTTDDQAIALLRNNFKPIERSVALETQTMDGAFARNTERILLMKSDVPFEYVWLSFLDSHACILCGSMNGRRFKSPADAPMIPVHDRCRCSLVPVMRGESVELTDYSEWLAEQPESVQREVLGATRYNLYKDGMKVEGFVNDGRKLTLEEVYRRNAGGIMDKSAAEQEAYAKRAYEEIRNRDAKADIAKVSKSSGLSEADVEKIRRHLFFNEHQLDGVLKRFDESAEVAAAWEALQQGRAKEADVLLLNHELEELTLMEKYGYTYSAAHWLANMKYPWQFKIKGSMSDEQIQEIIKQQLDDLL